MHACTLRVNKGSCPTVFPISIILGNENNLLANWYQMFLLSPAAQNNNFIEHNAHLMSQARLPTLGEISAHAIIYVHDIAWRFTSLPTSLKGNFCYSSASVVWFVN